MKIENTQKAQRKIRFLVTRSQKSLSQHSGKMQAAPKAEEMMVSSPKNIADDKE